MDYLSVAAIAIFAVTLFLMIKRPFGLRLGYAAGIGAIASLLLGTVSLGQAATSFLNIWDAALAFLGIVALSVTLDAMGFFKWAAFRVVKMAGGNGLRLFFYVSLLTAAVSILFANDSAVLILTPIVLEIVACLGIDKKGKLAYLFSAGLMADTAAMPLITSNPINILSADFFKYSFVQHLIFMGPVAVAVILSSLALFWLFFRKQIPKAYDMEAADRLTAGKTSHFAASAADQLATLVAIDVGYVLTSLDRFPVSIVICSGAAFLVAVYWFTLKWNGSVNGEKKGLIGLGKGHQLGHRAVHVQHLPRRPRLGNRRHHKPARLCARGDKQAALGSGDFRAKHGRHRRRQLHEQLAHDHPRVLKHPAHRRLGSALTGLIFSNIIGNNLGPHFFPLGSLAIVIWLETMKRKGVTISLKEYLKVGAVLSIVQVAVASVVLWAELIAGLKLF